MPQRVVHAEYPWSRWSAANVLVPGELADRAVPVRLARRRPGQCLHRHVWLLVTTDRDRVVGLGVVRTCSRSLVETKPASVNLLRRFSIQRKGPCVMGCVLGVDDVRGKPRPDTSRPEFRFPISGYSYGAARQSYEFGAAAHGLPYRLSLAGGGSLS